jgi:hypothetical protein
MQKHSRLHRRLPLRLMIAFLSALSPVGAVGNPTIVLPQDHPIDISPYELKTVYSDNFTRPQKIQREQDLIAEAPDGTWHRKSAPEADAQWIAEGTGGCIMKDGKLWVAPTPFNTDGEPQAGTRSHMVVWNRQVLPADFLLEWDVNPCGSSNGLLMVFFCAAGKGGGGLFDLSQPPRRAVYDGYLRGEISDYSDSYWSRNKVPAGESESNRLRKNPGAKLVSEGQSLTTGRADVTHHIRILKVGAHIQIEVNGKIVNEWTDPDPPLGAGCFGLRSMAGITKVAYSNFKVSQVSSRTATSSPTIQDRVEVRRFAGNPIIRPEMLPGKDGDNINGPSLIHVPSWVADRLGNYYLYFANHTGKYIRMAYADKLAGPWKIYSPGVLQLSNVRSCTGHIASPDVLIDDGKKEIRMYFHGPAKGAHVQKSFLAISSDGIHFKASDEPLGWPYFKVFEWNNNWFAVAKGGRLYRSDTGLSSFEAWPFLLPGVHHLGLDGPGARHVALQPVGNVLWIYYSNIGDDPERILRRRVDLTADWHDWKSQDPQEVLRPEEDYEGANLKQKKSHVGESTGPENAVRDPNIFTDTDGRVYLLYSVAGESGIGIAELQQNRENSR